MTTDNSARIFMEGYGYDQSSDVDDSNPSQYHENTYGYDQSTGDKATNYCLSEYSTNYPKQNNGGLPVKLAFTKPPKSLVHSNVIVKQPVSSTVVFAQPPTYMGLSIVTCICCFWPLGIAATVYSLASSNAAERMDFTTAKSQGRTAKRLSIASIILGIIMYIIIGILVHRYPLLPN